MPETTAAVQAWAAREALAFAPDTPQTFTAAVDQMLAALGEGLTVPVPARLLPTRSLPGPVPALAPRARSEKNSTYFPLTPQSLADFDWLAVLDTIA